MENFDDQANAIRLRKEPQQWKIISLKECPVPEEMRLCDTPQKAVEYWRLHVEGHPFFDSERECFVLLMLNTKLRVRGHHFVSVGSLSESIAHPRDVFRAAVVGASYTVVLMHNHPSGEPLPSHADTTCTRRLCDAGKILGIEVLDHIIVGHQRYHSFRETGLM
jgi:DNA repair protein RadC